MHIPQYKLFDFAYFPRFDESVQELANSLAEKENWHSSQDSEDYSILKSYLKHTFRRLQDEKKIKFADKYASFNTGLSLCANIVEGFLR